MKNFILLLATLFYISSYTQETIDIETVTPSSITVCDVSENQTISISNNTNATLTNNVIAIQLPTGIEYVQASINEESNFNIQENNVNTNSNLTFNCNDIPANGSVVFSIQTEANLDAITHQQEGNTFRNTIVLNTNNTSKTHKSVAYNVYYAALNITKVTPAAETVITGDTFNRDIKIVNAGNGRLNEFTLATTFNKEGVLLTNTNIGTLDTNTGNLILSGDDFKTIGNNDAYFDTNESITVTQKLIAEGCTPSTVTATSNTSWGCNANTRIGTNSYANTSINLKNPNLSISATGYISSKFAQEASNQQIVLQNKGLGYATNVTVDIYKSSGNGYDTSIFSAIDTNSITYQIGINGTPIAISPTTTFATDSTGKYTCLGNNPIGRAIVTLPINIAPNEKIILKWNNYHCSISECNDENLMGWKYKVDYKDSCEINDYTATKTGLGPTELNMTTFTETPTDIKDGETLPFVYTISSHDNNLPIGTNAQYEVILTLPEGLSFSGNSEDFIWSSSPLTWTANTINFDVNTRKLTGTFLIPEPFNIQKSEIKFNLTGDCSNTTSGTKTLNLDINYITDTDCNDCKVAMICNQTSTTKLHCPQENCEGLSFQSFKLNRTNYGQPDNDTNGLADTNSNLDLNKLKTNRVMVGDTLQTTYKATVQTGMNHNKFVNFFVEADIDYGKNLTFINGAINITENTTNNTYTATNINVEAVDGNASAKKFRYSFYPANNSSVLPNTPGYDQFYFTDGDEIEFTINYKVTGNIGGNVKEVTINNDLFTSSLNTPWGADANVLSSDKWACDDYDGRFTLIGYYFDTGKPEVYNVTSCTKTVAQNFYLSIGDCCDNFGGGNLFPYEYRNWAHIKEATVQIPNNYTVLNMYLKQFRTKATNSTATQTINNIEPYHNSGGFMKFDLEQHYKEFGGDLQYSDDGFNGTLYIELAPSCDVPVNVRENINWQFKFAKTNNIGGGETDWLTTSPDKIKYNPTTLEILSTNPIVDGLGKTVSWNVTVKNTTAKSDAANSWLHFKNPSGNIEFISITDDETNEPLSLTSDYYQLGTIQKNAQKSYTVVGKYSACAPDYIVAYSGYECTGYPTDFANFKCNYATLGLHVEPKDAEPQVKITGTTIGDECSSTVEITVEVASVRFAHLDNVEIDITSIGNSMSFIANSGQFKYPLSGDFTPVTNPEINSDNSTYKIVDLSSDIKENGVPGVLDLDKNRFQLKFQMNLEDNFQSGDFAQLTIRSKKICGDNLPIINLNYDPSVKFNQNDLAGLTNDISNSWGVSWGDYDNDGFDDLYVAEYDKTKGSFLYHNNRDGSFTKVTNSAITNDLGSAIAGTWGDYNNDGLLDLFVANNTGAVNALYKNLGAGNFSRVTTGAIANYGGYCHGASWVDYNNDGHLDLFVTEFMPTRFNLLYKNNGDETFTEIKNTTLVQEAKYSIGATWADYDNDGDMDVFVPATNGASNSLFRNNGADVFEKMENIGISADMSNSVGCSWGDYDNDNDLDLFVTNTSGQNNFFYENNGDGTFTQITNKIITTDGGHSSSSNWVDFDNDGDLDLYVCNDQDDENKLYINNGNRTFSMPETPLSTNLGNSYSQAWSDFDNDGDLDLFVGNHSNEKNVFFENSRANCNQWLCVNLTGNNSNKSAIGAKIKVKATIYGTSVWQLKEISAQTGGGAGSQNSLKSIFGLGNATTVEKVIVEWPSGYQQEFDNINTNDCLDVIEEEGIQVCGTVYHDENLNCIQEEGEKGISGIIIKTSPGNRKVTTDKNGNYQLYLSPGEYTISQETKEGWNSTCNFSQNEGYNLNLQTGNNYCGNNFGNTTACINPDLNITLGTTALRKGFRNEYSVVFGNDGIGDAQDVEINIEFPEDIIPVDATIPWTEKTENISSTTYTWNIETIEALSNQALIITDSISVASSIDKELSVVANISANSNDCNIDNNTVTDINPVVGAVDPNDILVFPKGEGDAGYIYQTQVLRYKIRFQNIGTYYAQNVTIDNIVPDELDISSIHDITSSHSYVIVQNGNALQFKFNNIFLPESAKDELGSNGYIEYKIYPKNTIDAGTAIVNQAAIVFDFEAPLETNQVVNTIKLNNEGATNALYISPNPVEDNTTIGILIDSSKYNTPTKIKHVDLYNTNGQTLKNVKYSLHDSSITLNASNLSSGVYLVVVYDENNKKYVGKLMKK